MTHKPKITDDLALAFHFAVSKKSIDRKGLDELKKDLLELAQARRNHSFVFIENEVSVVGCASVDFTTRGAKKKRKVAKK